MQKYLPVLRSCPFFTGLTDDEILSILHCVSAAKITRPRGSYIFRAGDSIEVCQRDKVAMIDFLKILFFITSESRFGNTRQL